MSTATTLDLFRLTAADKKILLAAADIIEMNGWCQGDFLDYDELDAAHRQGIELPLSACAVDIYGAINIAANGTPNRLSEPGDHAVAVLAAYLGVPAGICGVGGWNDDPDRTAEQVITALRACATEQEVAA
ncbi:hypothetical protein NE236_41660 [Actinoallomurus purpureus]|uniref:DUF6197 family protein n=1 Tax=Actinoallomurus purpureus TaxID=478114 RepID=UPI0020927765|nr:hypothetical protein [Actinoallomurus purpureus]MCO6011477.1 hypothetical protein [Actinoallomurus purpureus]